MNNFDFLKSPHDVLEEVRKNVKSRRKEKKMTQAELASRSGVSLGSIKRFERTGEISFSSLVMIGFILGYEEDFEKLFSKRTYSSIQEIIDEWK